MWHSLLDKQEVTGSSPVGNPLRKHALEVRDRHLIVQRLSGREVEAFISNSHIGPDLEIEIFLLGPQTAGS